MRRLLALLLILPLAMGQSSLGQHVMAPVQTVVDEVAGIVVVAVEEARFDGTPDEANSRLAALQGFVDGFEEQRFRSSSPAESFGLAAALIDAEALVGGIYSLPGGLGLVSRADNACASWHSNATKKDVETWDRGLTAATVELTAIAAFMRDMATRLPSDVRVALLHDAADRLDAFVVQDATPARGCIDEVAIVTGAQVDLESLVLRVVPSRSWPSGHVDLFGAVAGGNGTAHLRSPGLGLDLEVQASNVFSHGLRVPRETALQDHVIQATSGGLAQNATLSVQKAPLRIVLDHPERVAPGAGLHVTARLAGPLAAELEGTMLQWTGAVAADTLITDGAATVALVAPDEGSLVGQVGHPGSDVIRAATVSYVISVQTPIPPAPDQTTGSDGPVRPGNAPTREVVAVTLLIAGVIAVALVARLWRRRQVKRGRRRAPIGPFTLPRGLVAAVAAFITWLRRLGRASPGTTAREAAREHPVLADLVEPFEKRRYGGVEGDDDVALDQLKRTAQRLAQEGR